MATIKDVAKRAGVGIATVSRVLNESGYFDEGTGRAVLKAVADLGYRRNIHWARLARNSSETICFLLGNRDSMNSMQVRLLMAAERLLHENGYDLVFAGFRYSASERADRLQLPRMLSEKGIVDGVILAGLHYANLLEAFAGLELPYVVLGNTFGGTPRSIRRDAVTYDDVAGAYEATSYLARLGHRRIAFVGNAQLPWFARRYEGYQRAIGQGRLQETGVTDAWQVSNLKYGQLSAAQLLRRTHPPTAVFAGNDEIAAGVWKELVKRRIVIPREISLMGFGDREEFSVLEPPLTTVSAFQEKLGEELARMLLDKLRQPGLRLDSRVFPCKIVERGSCGPPVARLEYVEKIP